MNYHLTAEQTDLQLMTREFAEKELIPIAAEYDRKGEFPMEAFKKAVTMGLTCLDLPEEWGGVCNGRSLAAALAFGAEGVVIGTRFLTASECCISQNHKQWIIDHSEKDTVLCQRAIKNIIRVAHNDAADECLEMEKKPGVTLQDLMPIISGAAGKAAYQSGDTSRGMFAVGQDIGLIHDVKPAKEIIDEMIQEAFETVTRLNKLASH